MMMTLNLHRTCTAADATYNLEYNSWRWQGVILASPRLGGRRGRRREAARAVAGLRRAGGVLNLAVSSRALAGCLRWCAAWPCWTSAWLSRLVVLTVAVGRQCGHDVAVADAAEAVDDHDLSVWLRAVRRAFAAP